MRKKLLAVLMAATLAMSLMACGSDESADSHNNASVEENSSTESEETNDSNDLKDDGVIDFEGDSFKVTYTRHEIGTDWDGNTCLYYYYNFTNNGEEATSAAATAYNQCFQNGIECEVALTDYNAEMDNYLKDIQPGVTLEVCEVFVLTDNSEVTIEASDWVSFSNDKDVQKITLE